MRQFAVRAATLAGLATVGFAIALAAAPGRRSLAVAVYALALGAVAVIALLGALAAALPQGRVRGGKPPDVKEPPLAQLESVRRAVHLGRASAHDLHTRVRPLVSEIAAARLARNRGVSLAVELERARALLGPRAWELVRPDRVPPDDRSAAGWSDAELSALVDELEGI